MVHRRTLRDDDRGVWEALNETDGVTHEHVIKRLGKPLVVTGKHYLVSCPLRFVF